VSSRTRRKCFHAEIRLLTSAATILELTLSLLADTREAWRSYDYVWLPSDDVVVSPTFVAKPTWQKAIGKA